jgi:hypothetical protein
MVITYAHGVPVYEPANDIELGEWRPALGEVLQFVKISRREYWIFNCGSYLGSASRLTYADAWQAVAGENRLCVAPLHSLLECAERLMTSARRGGCG